MPQKNCTAQNDVIEISTPRLRNGVAFLSTPSACAATAAFLVEHQIDGADGAADEWRSIMLYDPNTKLNVTGITGPSLSAWAEVPVMHKIRARRTDANGGNGWVNFDFEEG